MSDWYILDENKNPVPTSIEQWSKWSQVRENKIIQKTYIRNVEVSTVFLGLNHGLIGEPPLLFETMIFGGKEDQYAQRYYTYKQAVKGHHEACEMVINS